MKLNNESIVNPVLNNISKPFFSRKEIEEAAFLCIPDFSKGKMRNLLEDMLKLGAINRVGRNCYVKGNGKLAYRGRLSELALQVKEKIEMDFPYLEFQIWELTWLNEFLNHLVAHNRIFVNVENDGCEFVYTALNSEYGNSLLLKPSEKEIDYYSKDNGIIIDRLVSEAPASEPHIPALETVIVEMFGGKVLPQLISKGDYAETLEIMFSKYIIDQSRLFRYARRRNKERIIVDYIGNNTNISLIVEG